MRAMFLYWQTNVEEDMRGRRRVGSCLIQCCMAVLSNLGVVVGYLSCHEPALGMPRRDNICATFSVKTCEKSADYYNSFYYKGLRFPPRQKRLLLMSSLATQLYTVGGMMRRWWRGLATHSHMPILKKMQLITFLHIICSKFLWKE